MSDDLARRLAAGEASAYRALYDLHGPLLYRTALRLLGNSEDAQDAVQEVFMAIVRGRERLTEVLNLKAYLFASLRHVVGRMLRSRRAGEAALEGHRGVASPPGLKATDDHPSPWDLAARLPLEQREVLALKIHGELTFKEIAAVCGVSPNTAASRYRYALEKLKALLEPRQC